MNTAQLMEVLGGGAAKYSFSPPWKGRRQVIVAPMTLLDGRALTYVYEADDTGTVTQATGGGSPTILGTLDGHPSHQEVLSRFGYSLKT